jgi:hypothetical protein
VVRVGWIRTTGSCVHSATKTRVIR